MLASLYKITNKVNGKLYIGMTTQKPYRRFRQHVNSNKSLISRAIRKYGECNFTMEVILVAHYEDVEDLEICAINYYKSHSTENGYNVLRRKQSTNIMSEKIDFKDKMEVLIGNACYVTGFWFPSHKRASKTLGISLDLLEKYLENTPDEMSFDKIRQIGRSSTSMKSTLKGYKVCLKDVTFLSVAKAVESGLLNKGQCKWILDNGFSGTLKDFLMFWEDRLRQIKIESQELRILDKTHHNILPVILNDVEYLSITDACRKTGISRHNLTKMCRDDNITNARFKQ